MKNRDWTLGFGPVTLQPGETKRIDVQPKCAFRAEKVFSETENAGIKLTAIFLGPREVLELNGDSIDLRNSIDLNNIPWSKPELPIEVEITNHNGNEHTVYFSILGEASL